MAQVDSMGCGPFLHSEQGEALHLIGRICIGVLTGEHDLVNACSNA
jgi:hypothetical protein